MVLIEEEKVDAIVVKAIKELVKDEDIFDDLVTILTDTMLYSHSLAVAQYSVAIGLVFGFDEKKLNNLAKAGVLHDFGKQFIDRRVLYKPGRLTEDEFKLVQQHPELGYENIKDKTKDKLILKAVYQHHEKCTGKGYPRGIREDDLDIEIITVADIFSALTEARVYKKAMQASKAFEILENDEGLNQKVVSKLREAVFDEWEAFSNARKFARFFRQFFAYRIELEWEFDPAQG